MSKTIITIRPETPRDYEAIRDVHVDAFHGDHGEEVATLVDRIRSSDRYRNEYSLVAEVNGQVVGHALLSYIDIIQPDGHVEQVLALAPLGVRSDQQKKGVGSRLVGAAIEAAEANLEPAIILEGIPAYYPRFGFEPAHQAGIHYPKNVRPEAAKIKKLSSYAGKPQGQVRYPEAFDHLQS